MVRNALDSVRKSIFVPAIRLIRPPEGERKMPPEGERKMRSIPQMTIVEMKCGA